MRPRALLAVCATFVAVTAPQLALGNSSASVHVFQVGWEIHNGYYLVRPGDAGHYFPRFQNPDAQAAFDEFFRTENLARVVGKVVYCRCEGVWLEEPGELSEFAISSATLYAEAPVIVR